jgi:hypothetical protein
MHFVSENTERLRPKPTMNLLMDIRVSNINVSELLQMEKELRR